MRAGRPRGRVGSPGWTGSGRACVVLALAVGCAKVGNAPPPSGAGGAAGTTGAAGTGGPDATSSGMAGTPPDGGSDADDDGPSMIVPTRCTGLCTDFPVDPVIDIG